MQTYSTFSPTGFDSKGSFLPEQGDWLVAPCKRNRDSQSLDLSNWDKQIERLGGEHAQRVQIHRFGHWACGWFEIVLINPRSKKAKIGREIEKELENYPVLDENDFSTREWNNYLAAFKDDYQSQFISEIENFAEENDIEMESGFLETISIERFQEFFESLIPSGEYFIEEYPQFDYAVKNFTVENIKKFLFPVFESADQIKMDL